MALVTMPAAPVPANIEWELDVPSEENESEFAGSSRITLLTEKPRWYATVTFPPILAEPNVYAWRAFVVDVDGIANTFRVVACERDQITGVSPLVKGAGQSGTALTTDGWGAAGTKLKRGQFVTVNNELKMLMADVVADAGGNATIAFKPYLRKSPADNAPLEVRRPYAYVQMADRRNGWKVGIGQNYAISFPVKEAIRNG